MRKIAVMSYETLNKLYYRNPSAYDNVYRERFEGSSTIRLDFYIDGNQSFIVQDNDVINLISAILRNDKKVAEICFNIPDTAIEYYESKCLIDEIITTNRIEGVHSTRRDVEDTLQTLLDRSSVKGKQYRFFGLVNKYRKLLSNEEVSLLTCRDVRSLYDELVLPEVTKDDPDNLPDGTIFRKGQVTVYDAYQRPIHNGSYPEEKIIEQMEKALKIFGDQNIEPLYRCCLFHFLFEYIHPFYDGNGRLGRFMLSYGLSKQLYDLTAFRISETIQENIGSYYDSFKTCSHRLNKGDLTPFVITMLDFIRKAQEDLIRTLSDKLAEQKYYYAALRSALPFQNTDTIRLGEILIQAMVYSENGLTKRELADHLQVSEGTISNWLKTFKNKDMLYVLKNKKSHYYQINKDSLQPVVENN